ncbi:MAG: hypothetical protein N3G20_05925, partial [Verrucomicrobiae bacterium]|nr:hypothetical protein [Verrucomicrobiae bacterium]
FWLARYVAVMSVCDSHAAWTSDVTLAITHAQPNGRRKWLPFIPLFFMGQPDWDSNFLLTRTARIVIVKFGLHWCDGRGELTVVRVRSGDRTCADRVARLAQR